MTLNKKSKKWKDEELELFAIILADNQNAFAESSKTFRLKKTKAIIYCCIFSKYRLLPIDFACL